jgi:hypothetical protein
MGRHTTRPLRHCETFCKPLLQQRSPFVGLRVISRLVSHLFVTTLGWCVSIGVDARRTETVGTYHFEVILLFVSLPLSFLAKVLRQCKMLFRRDGGVDQLCCLFSSQLSCRDWCGEAGLGCACPDRPNQNQGCEYCGFRMSSFHGHRRYLRRNTGSRRTNSTPSNGPAARCTCALKVPPLVDPYRYTCDGLRWN